MTQVVKEAWGNRDGETVEVNNIIIVAADIGRKLEFGWLGVRAMEIVGLGGWVVSFLRPSLTLILTWVTSCGCMVSFWFFSEEP